MDKCQISFLNTLFFKGIIWTIIIFIPNIYEWIFLFIIYSFYFILTHYKPTATYAWFLTRLHEIMEQLEQAFFTHFCVHSGVFFY